MCKIQEQVLFQVLTGEEIQVNHKQSSKEWEKLEQEVTRIFNQHGYHAQHKKRLKGKSGVEHEIDVVAEYQAPLHSSKLLIECKAHRDPMKSMT